MKQKQTIGYIVDMVVRSAETGKTIDKFSNYPLLKAIAILEIKYSLKEKLEAEQRRLQAKWAKEAGQLRTNLKAAFGLEDKKIEDVQTDHTATLSLDKHLCQNCYTRVVCSDKKKVD